MNEPALPLILPWDVYNQKLVANVYPKDWNNPTPVSRYNLVVLGAGTAGLVCAVGAAGLGAKVALVEKHLMGGDCLNVGCIPSKAIIRAARAVAEVGRAVEFGINLQPFSRPLASLSPSDGERDGVRGAPVEVDFG